MSQVTELRRVTAEQIAASVRPGPSSILIFGATGTGKTVAITALKSAYESLGQLASTRDDAPELWFNTYDVTAYSAKTDLQNEEASRTFGAAQAVIVLCLTGPQARAVAPCLEQYMGGCQIIPEELMRTADLQAIVFSRTEPPALLALDPAKKNSVLS